MQRDFTLLMLVTHVLSGYLECYSDVIKDMIGQLKWTQAAVIHDIENILMLRKVEQIRFLTYKINGNSALYTVLQEIHAEMFPTVNVILVVQNTNLLIKLMHEADNFDTRNNHSTDWSHHSKLLVVSLVASVVNPEVMKLKNLQNVAVLTQRPRYCANGVQVFSFTTDVGAFKFNIIDDTGGSVMLKVFPNTKYRYNGRSLRVSTLEFWFGSHSPNWHIGNNQIIGKIGSKQKLKREHISETLLTRFKTDRENFHGRLVTKRESVQNVLITAPPFVIAEGTAVNNGVPYTGYCIEILHTIADHLNLTLQYIPARDGIWGWIEDGMMGQLRRREIDLIASEMVVHVKRAQQTDYIMPYLYTDELVLLYKMPQVAQSIFLLAGPFQLLVYITYSAVMFAVLALYVLIEITMPSEEKTRRKPVSFNCWSVIKASLKQGDSLEDITAPGRIILTFWWLLVILFSAIYCGNLTASLAASSTLNKFGRIDDIIDSGYSVGYLPGSIVEQQLKSSRNDAVKRLYQTIRVLADMDSSVMSRVLEHHIQRVKKGKYAFVTYSHNVDVLIQNECGLSKLHFNDIKQEPLAFVVQKNSPFKKNIDEVMERLRSTGVLDKMWKRWTNQTKTRECAGRGHIVTGAGVVTCAGIGLASIILFVEVLIMRFKIKCLCSFT